MKSPTLQYLDEHMFIDETQRLNRIFVQDAVKEWELHGSDDFRMFIKNYLDVRWIELLRSN